MHTPTKPAATTGERYCRTCHKTRQHTIHAEGSTSCRWCGAHDDRRGWRPTWR